MLITPAFAQTASSSGGGDIFNMLMPMVLIFAIMYFLLIRPQQKKHKQHQAKLAAVKRGDKVITGGGIYGTVRRVGEEGRVQVEIAREVEVEVLSSTLTDVLIKGNPQPAAATPGGGLLGRFFSGGGGSVQSSRAEPAKSKVAPGRIRKKARADPTEPKVAPGRIRKKARADPTEPKVAPGKTRKKTRADPTETDATKDDSSEVGN